MSFSCEICGAQKAKTVFEGKIRHGKFGSFSNHDCLISHCSNCGVERLNEDACQDPEFYKTANYRDLLNEPKQEAIDRANRNYSTVKRLLANWPEMLTGKTVAEVGCASGFFMDIITPRVKSAITVEPCRIYHKGLSSRGYEIYSFIDDALSKWSNSVDFVFCFSVIEHTNNPRSFLTGIANLLKPGGSLIISTPNRRDLLIDLQPEIYRPFFYRTVHRWYFDADALTECASRAGFRSIEVQCIHRFGLSNAMVWLKEGRPSGFNFLPHLDDPQLDQYWKNYLEKRGVGDYLYAKMQRQTIDEKTI